MSVPCLFLVCAAVLPGQTQAIPFLDDSQVQAINLTMDPSDWATLQQDYQQNTYYHATFTWNGIGENIGVRSHGAGSRSPIKPNLDLNFAKYQKTQTFLGLPFVVIKANNEDASNLREWISMKLFRRMGIPAPREAPAQVYMNGQLLGFYYIVEHLDETFLERNFGESSGYFYEYQSLNNYDFENLGADPNSYAPFLDLKTNQASPDLQTFANLVQIINQPPGASFTDDAFIGALSQYIDPKQFLTYGATEQVLSGSDSLIGGQQGMNNFYLYQFAGTTVYNVIPWDKDFTFSDATRDIMEGISNGPNINLLAKRLTAIPQYLQVYLNAVAKAQSLMGGAGGWADMEITREYGVIHAAALNDPNKQCMNAGVLLSCGSQEFENDIRRIHAFLSARSGTVLSEMFADGYQPSTGGPQVLPGGVTSVGGMHALSPGGLATIVGTGLAAKDVASSVPWPRVMGGAYVAVDGVRAPLHTTDSGSIEFEAPGDIPVGSCSVVVSVNGDMSPTINATVQPSTPSILSVVHQDGSPVSALSPPVTGETLEIFATGLGSINNNLPIGAAGPADPVDTTVATPQVHVGNIPLNVTFSGLAPGFVGLYQVNAVVPSGFTSDATVTLTLADGGQQGNWTLR